MDSALFVYKLTSRKEIVRNKISEDCICCLVLFVFISFNLHIMVYIAQ